MRIMKEIIPAPAHVRTTLASKDRTKAFSVIGLAQMNK